ncbi:MAG: HAD-IA family hydrolase [Rikenellaceae bacterium]
MKYRLVVVFDLDDTLYQEIDYLKSAYKHIAEQIAPDYCEDLYAKMFKLWSQGDDVFANIELLYPNETKPRLLNTYRTHMPNISIEPSIFEMLIEFKNKGYVLGIVTDGRAETQTNKIEALGLDTLIDKSNIYISEATGFTKPNPFSFVEFERRFPNCSYYYIGDNVTKDFLAANTLGWTTIGLKDSGNNIHKHPDKLGEEFEPKIWIDDLRELNSIINKNE